MNTEKLILFIENCECDDRLRAIHLSFMTAMIFCWIKSGLQDSFKITRKVIMDIAKIRSTATYHKCIQDLCTFGYFDYEPTFHPLKASTVTIKV